MPELHGQNAQVLLCFLILFAEDVDPDKVLRRYHGLDLEVGGFVKGAQGAFTCSLSLACGVFSPIFHDAIFSSAIQSEAHSDCILVVRTEMQYVLYQREIELRTRSMSHLLSSVDPVLYCDTNGPTHAPTGLIACFIGCFSVCLLLRLGHCGLCGALSCFTERCVHCLCATAAAALLFALCVLIFSIPASDATDSANHHPWINHESLMTISRCQSLQ